MKVGENYHKFCHVAPVYIDWAGGVREYGWAEGRERGVGLNQKAA
jgi:hypothetical protein